LPVVSAASAFSSETRGTFSQPSRRISFARFAIHLVASVSAGPPWVGLYLKPPSRGGLCDGVMMMPSARSGPVVRTPPDVPAPLARRIACERAGVGVNRSRASIRTSTPFAARTSIADFHAGSERTWVSRPMNSGPSVPWLARYSTMACVVATMWASLKAPSREDPRCPEVPKATFWAGLSTSGTMS